MATGLLTEQDVEYPDSDGEPMADNTLQLKWILKLYAGLEHVFAHRPDVFVAGDLLWYLKKGDNQTRIAPDVMVVFGRPKGDRGSWRPWDEAGATPQVVFEVLSPGNRPGEMSRKFLCYEEQQVEEYYIIDPDVPMIQGWLLRDGRFQEIESIDGWTSPRLGITFRTVDDRLVVTAPDGWDFKDVGVLADEASRAEAEARRAEAEAQRAERLADKLRKLGIDPDSP